MHAYLIWTHGNSVAIIEAFHEEEPVALRLRDLQVFPLKDETVFQEFCLALWKRILKDPNTQLNGRRGQRQKGVDLFGRRNRTEEWIGVQCKVRTGGVLTETDILDDVKSAKDFNPRLTELVFATTARRDEALQEFVRVQSEKYMKDGYFSVSLCSWDEIELELSKEDNIDILQRFYKDFFINYENLGIAVFRIIRISIGVGGSVDTSYELLIGRTPSSSEPGSYMGLDYWRGNYFIANLNGRKIETFSLPVHDSDFEDAQVFVTKRDAYIIAEWLNGINSFDDLLYGDSDYHIKLISEEDYEAFRKSLRG
ncbi:MAG: hypothetical protein HY879_13505 [Deltaproteobacteria bacterium]|nr:hypothetical protein [Deltaproteobacteria bacterium]